MKKSIAALILTSLPVAAWAQVPEAETPPADPPPADPAPAETPAGTETPAPVPAAEDKAGTSVRYDKGFVFATEDGKFKLKIVGRVQARWQLETSDADGAEIEHEFFLPRARVTLEGHAFGDVEYKFQTEFGQGLTYLRDFYLDAPLSSFRVRAGQWKRPYSRQHITSSGNLQFGDRSILDRFSGAGRDIGVAIHNNYEKSPEGLEWALGVFNGTSERPSFECVIEDPMMPEAIDCDNGTNRPGDIGPAVVARVGFNSADLKGYSEADLEGGPARWGVGLSYFGDLGQGESELMVHRVAVDAILKANGLSVTGGFYLFKVGEADPEIGFFGQAGYMLVPRKHELAARFSRAADAPAGTEENDMEITAGHSWYMHGHSLKWQTNGSLRKNTADGEPNVFIVLSQAQLVF